MSVKDSVIKYLTKKRIIFFQDDLGDVYAWDHDDNEIKLGKLGRELSLKFPFASCEFWLEGHDFYIKKGKTEYTYTLLKYAETACYVGKFYFD